MSDVKLNKQQLSAVETKINQNVLVSSAAGSGKTTVLSEKVAYHIACGDILPNQLLVLTFTNNAAHEMKERIIKRVQSLANKGLEETKIAINSAHIQTFDSFALEIVQAYAGKLGIPNNTFIANDFVIEAKKKEILDNILNELYKTKPEETAKFLAKYNCKDDKKTKQIILDVLDKIENLSLSNQSTFIDNIKNKFFTKEFFEQCYSKMVQIIETKIEIKKHEEKITEKKLENFKKKEYEALGDNEIEKNKYFSTKEDVLFLIEIVKQIKIRLDDYKRQSNCYTFHDIALMALHLLNDKDIAKDVRERYEYIMVDEYQDTNDIQEAVINILTQTKTNGKSSALFCVGDAKQSIYRFRNANLQIFLDREEDYKNNPTHGKTIHMTYNFRSCKEVIDDVNEIFNVFMTKKQGGIEYNNDDNRLFYPNDKNYKHNDENGLHILSTDDKKLLDLKADEIKKWEIRAIIQDIKQKVDSKEYEYKDFTILIRSKSNIGLYEREFASAGIPLNNRIVTNLVEINVVMLINSLINILALLQKYKKTEPLIKEKLKHLYASVVRSYIFKDDDIYTDQYIHDQLSTEKWIDDLLFDKLLSFIKDNASLCMSKKFIKLLNEFKIIDKLHTLPESCTNIEKIESLYEIILSVEQSGGDLVNFSELLTIISQYKIDIESETVVDIGNAVKLMTIHQSKGLQNKVIYLPHSSNHIGGEDARKKPDYTFSIDKGILLPIYGGFEKDSPGFKTLVKKLNDISDIEDSEDINEHVRLYYVALTRAQEKIYIVGWPKLKKIDKGEGYEIANKPKYTLFHMLEQVYNPTKQVIDWLSPNWFKPGKWHNIKVDLGLRQKPQLDLSKPKNINDKQIKFAIVQQEKASQEPILIDEELREFVNSGNDLHAIFERIDFNNIDLSFIKDSKYLQIVNKVLQMDLFKKELKGATFSHECQYYDETIHNAESIDLLAIKDGIYYIIDYKYSNIDKPEYVKQMRIYGENVAKLFNIDKKQIRLKLLSLTQAKLKDIDFE